jgi:hypothetical protein
MRQQRQSQQQPLRHLMAAFMFCALRHAHADPIPLVARSLIPDWSCPGQNEGQAPYDIPTLDMQALATAIQTNSLSSGQLPDWIEIKAGHGIAIVAGDVQVCVQNQYLFDNSHYSRSDIALVVAQGMYNCCGGEAHLQQTCNAKPWVTIKGDTGLKAIATVGKTGDECKGAPDARDYLEAGEIAAKTGKFFWDIFMPLITGHP